MSDLSNEQSWIKVLDLVSRTIAHPHYLVTPHDRNRALVIISFLSDDNEMVEYLYSQLSQSEHDQIKAIRKQVTNV